VAGGTSSAPAPVAFVRHDRCPRCASTRTSSARHAFRQGPMTSCYLLRMPDSAEQTLTREDGTGRGGSPFLSPGLYVCVECDRLLAGGARYSLAEVDEVVIGRGPERRAELRPGPHGSTMFLFIPDRRISSVHVRIRRREGAWLACDAGSKNGML